MDRREKMSKEMRAKQFMPFDALKGLRAVLREKEIEHENKIKNEIKKRWFNLTFLAKKQKKDMFFISFFIFFTFFY